jgi:uncharacterized protein (TIGR02453 family)
MTPFRGFPKEMLAFFDQLRENNSKEWFERHKKEYEDYVKKPSEDFVLDMGEKLKSLSPEVLAIPKINRSLFRLNRDTRFSRDKSPYKTNLGIWFWEGERKRMECSGFYFHVGSGLFMLGTGIHIFPKGLMTPYREAVVHKKLGPKLKKAVNRVEKDGYKLSGKHYKRIPPGYDNSHENAAFLLHNGLAAMYESEIPEALFTEDLVDQVFSHYRKMSPIHRWLREALG